MDITLVAVNSKYIHLNPAVRSIKYYLAQRGISAEIKEFSGKEEIHRASAKILETDAEFVAFSCYIWNIEYILKLAQTVKKSAPDRKIVLGGPEAYCNAESLLEKYPFIDTIISGEGEQATYEMITGDIKRKIIQGTPTDLSEIGFIYSDDDLSDKNRIFYYESSRGCPFNCAYCLSCIDKGVRYKPVEQVKEELEKFVSSGVRLVKFVDRTFNSDMPRAKKILEIIKNLGGNTEFHIEINPDSIDDEFVYMMSEIKKNIRIEAGLQSINPDTLAAVHRPCNLDRIKRNMRAIRIAGITIHLDLIAGLPHEDLKSFKKSFNFAFELAPDELQLGFLKVLPGTLMHKEAEKFGMVFDEFPPYEIISNSFLSSKDIVTLKNLEAVLDIYHNSGMLKHTENHLLQKFPSPFDLFDALGKYFAQKGYLDFPHQRADYFEFLYDFANDLKEELTKDYFLSCRGGKSPSWMKEFPLEKGKINLILSEGRFKDLPALEKIKPTERHKFVKFYSLDGRRFMVSYPDEMVIDITEEYDKTAV